jgi:uncharacterized damage-inducible protein DinB
MASTPIHAELLEELARHQAWADTQHWKTLRENSAALEDPEIRKRLNHMVMALRMLTTLARGGTPDTTGWKDIEPAGQLEAALCEANADLLEALKTVDLQNMIALPRGPRGPFEAPAGVLLLQAITHSQHHRAQNASRMRQLGANPPMTDFVVWYAIGRP